jgi:CofD-related protein of GAK system
MPASSSSETTVSVTRRITLPDPVRLERLRRVPELGPRILFFSGGTALRGLSQQLIRYTHNSIHLITPFDSGGSSAAIRKAFRMLSVGDLRNRLMALADQTLRGQPAVFALFTYRLPRDEPEGQLGGRLERMVDGRDPMVAAIDDPMRKLIRSHLRYFLEQMPPGFDLRGANIGNLILAGGYLNNNRHIDPVVYLFSRLVEVRGVVRPVTSAFLHLAAELESGEVVVGQHRLTGKEVPPIASPIRRLFLTRTVRRPEPCRPELREKVRALIRQADLICFPMGSFFTSLLATLLPAGVGQAVAESDAPKLFIPNTGEDPEMLGVDLPGSVSRLVGALREGGGQVPVSRLVQYVLLDSRAAGIPEGEVEAVRRLGPEVIDMPLVSDDSAPHLDAGKLARTLASLA